MYCSLWVAGGVLWGGRSIVGLWGARDSIPGRYCLAWLFDRQKKTRTMPGVVFAAIYSSMARENINALNPIAPIRLTVSVGASSSCILFTLLY